MAPVFTVAGQPYLEAVQLDNNKAVAKANRPIKKMLFKRITGEF